MKIPAVNDRINEDMATSGALLHKSEIRHSYPHCWRCKKPVMYRATPQWFISMEINDLREKALTAIDQVVWTPSWGKQRIYSMVEGRPDWCLSRQRAWGVPITVISCKDCGEIIKDKKLVEKIDELFLKEGADAWFRHDLEVFLEEGTTCAGCGGSAFVKEDDILDVWFDSGVSHAAVCEERAELRWPADLYLEGSDQHRGWFQSSLLTSVGTRGRAPFDGVLTHGYVVDGQGKKMSKSIGNVVAPQEVIDKYGAEILRLWVASEDYRDDVKVSEEILRQVSDSYRKIRNTLRYMLGNLSDFEPGRDRVKIADLPELDRWALKRFHELNSKIKKAYEKYECHSIYHNLNYFCGMTMSSFYLDIIKDRLYTAGTDSLSRRAAQTVLHDILDGMLKLMMPILSFTAAETWEHFHNLDDKAPLSRSIFFTEFVTADAEIIDAELDIKWNRLIEIRAEITRALEIARREKVIGHPLEAEVLLRSNADLQPFLEKEWQTIREISIVSALKRTDEIVETQLPPYVSEVIKGLVVMVRPAAGEKCERCWTRSTTVGTDARHPLLCDRCNSVMETIKVLEE
jgi:isoleucyl-tRNA synthetase